MREYKGYQTIEEDWFRFYREFPEIYDRFSTHSRTLANMVCDIFDLDDKDILEFGCGTGIATLELAKRARSIIAIEIEKGMIDYGIKKARQNQICNVEFIRANSLSLPLAVNSVDVAIAIFAELIHEQAFRVVKEGGLIIKAANHYRWYGGELRSVILGKNSISWLGYKSDRRLRELGYRYIDVWVDFNYRSVQEAIETYGFIFGRKAIDYLLEHEIQSIKQKARVFHKEVFKD